MHRFLPLLLLVSLCIAQGLSAAYRVEHLRCEYAEAPLGVDAAHPRLSWRVVSEERGQRQTAWQVLVASSLTLLDEHRGDLWDSGRVEGDATHAIPYRGSALVSSQRVHWKVRSWDREGNASAWSEPSTWTTGLLNPADWGATWIRASAEERLENTLLRREFTVKPGLVRAVVHVSGLGQYELFLNGGKVGDEVLSPGWTDYRDTILYDTRDVTSLLRAGANAAGLSLGNGMLHVERPEGRFAKFKGSLGPQRAILHLRLEYADGTVDTVVSDSTWKSSAGPITFSGIYGGEDFDARLVQQGWKEPGFDDSAWPAAVPFDGQSGELRGQSHAAEGIGPIEVGAPVSVRPLGATALLYDFGTNLSFMPRLRVSGPRGSTVRLTGGELVNEDGTINRSSMGGAHRGSAWWQYTKGSDAEESWFPQFYYLGSRYLHVELRPASEGGALPALTSLERVVVHSTARPVGKFAASDPTFNAIRELVRQAQRSNMVSILTDCPHREKLGWLEQNHINGPSLRYEWALDRLAAKNVRDMAEAQTEEGLIPNIAPEYTVFKGTFRAAAEWGASFIQVPWQQYVFSGDATLLREQYGAMRRYYAYLETKAAGGLLEEGLGDWYDVVLEKPGRANLTPARITATAHLYKNAVTLAKAAAVLGRTEEAVEFEAKAALVRSVFNRELYRPDTPEVYGTGSQTSLALPLALGLVDAGQREVVLNALLKDIAARGHSTTGAIGTLYLFRSLTDAGRTDLVQSLITNPDMPGYAYQLKRGATSLAESWTASPGASQNHFFLGPIVEWFYRDLVGISPDESQPGFKHILIQPNPVPGLAWAEAEHETPLGRVAVRWEQNSDGLRLSATIPTNARATVRILARPNAKLETDAASGVVDRGWEGGRAVLELESGTYTLTVPN